VALIIDEAQHALTSEAGVAAMVALKSARDQLNAGSDIRLMLVMSGSDRDKLLRLMNNARAPFFGSNVTPFRTLDRDFIAHVAQLIEKHDKRRKPVDVSKLWHAFAAFGYRPQFFINAVGAALNPISAVEGMLFEDAVFEAGQQHAADEETQMESDFIGLPIVQQAVLWRVLEKKGQFKPYDAAALTFYEELLGKALTPAQIQNALESLRARVPALVWKSLRGEYAVEDAAMARWYEKLRTSGRWPPGGVLSGPKRKVRTKRA
jgi:hypothetical protein